MGGSEPRLFAEWWADQLDRQGEPLTIPVKYAGGDGDARQSDDARWNGVDIGQVHLPRIIDAATDREGGLRSGRQQQQIDARECLVE
jgi:predicted GNAT superfamily acetyltransferase